MRQTAAYLGQHTGPDDRIQIYGMDPYVLFLAKRMSATPYLYAYDLNADAALAGGTGGRPDEAQAAVIVAMRDAHEPDILACMAARPTAPVVVFDWPPPISDADGLNPFGA